MCATTEIHRCYPRVSEFVAPSQGLLAREWMEEAKILSLTPYLVLQRQPIMGDLITARFPVDQYATFSNENNWFGQASSVRDSIAN